MFLREYINYKRNKIQWEYLDLIPTWACNLKCITCESWKRPRKFIDWGVATQIFNHPQFRHLKTLVIEGGEPTLWTELGTFIYYVMGYRPDCNIGIVTNGFLHNRIIEVARQMRQCKNRINWTISLNGMGAKHDESRGTKGSFERATATIEDLLTITNRVGIAYIPFKENFNHYWKVLELAESHGIPVTVSYPTNSARFGNPKWTMPSQEGLDVIYQDRLSRYPLFDKWAGQYFQTKVKNKELMPCFGGRSVIHINPDGVIRTCGWNETQSLGKVTIDGVELYDVDKVIGTVPHECQYRTGQICNICPLGYGLRRMMPHIIAWKLGLIK